MAVQDFNKFNGYGATFISTGSAITLPLPFDPDSIKVFNYTKFGTNSNDLVAFWFKGFPAGDALIVQRGTTTLTSVLETTNGVTEADSVGGQADSHVAISTISAANPGVVTTSVAHGLLTGARVVITKVLGMVEVNAPSRNPYMVNVLTSTTFELQDIKGNDIDTSGFTAYTSGGQVTKTGGPFSFAPPTWNLTLGTAIVGANSDVLYIEAFKYNVFDDLGDADDF